uniref:Family with sequence similarity 187 member A n=1 Tax=Callorhinchus milii TaxID=7868 RepID=A0A4W3HSM2_CALMI
IPPKPKTIINWSFSIYDTFEYIIEQKEDIFKTEGCPAFLMFQNAAYLAGMTFELPCSCKPEDVASVVWYYQKKLGRSQTKVLTDFNGTKILDSSQLHSGLGIDARFSILMFSLLVFRSQPQDSGHYICGSQNGDYFYAYDVDVQGFQNVHLTFEEKQEKPQPDVETKTYKIFTSFWDWTVCDRCGVRGEQKRVGLCHFQSRYLYFRYKKVGSDIVSCGSASVPRRYRYLLRKRKPEIMIRSCFVQCRSVKPPKEEEKFTYNVFGFSNSKISGARNVPVQTYIQPIGYPLTFTCPEARPEQAVAWDKENNPLYRKDYMVGLNNSRRIYIDHGNHLVFTFVQLNDRGTYYCWRQGQLVVGFRLTIGLQPKRSRSFYDPESIFALQTILSSYIILAAIFVFLQIVKCATYYFTCNC